MLGDRFLMPGESDVLGVGELIPLPDKCGARKPNPVLPTVFAHFWSGTLPSCRFQNL